MMASGHEVNVIVQDRARVDDAVGAQDILRESSRDGARLNSAEAHRFVREMLLCFATKRHVMRIARERSSLVCLRRGTESQQFPRAHEIGPRSARVVG